MPPKHSPQLKSMHVENLERRTMLSAVLAAATAAIDPTLAPAVQYHLTARPWRTRDVAASEYLDAAEASVRALVPHQFSSGQIIDPYTDQEQRAATPYFAFSIGVLNSAGRAQDLLDDGIRAMESATKQFAGGVTTIPQGAGEFYLPALADALPVYEKLLPASVTAPWRARLQTPVEDVIRGIDNNHRSYAMIGEWKRALAGLVPKSQAVAWIETNWKSAQRDRLAVDKLNLFHDDSSDPDSMTVEIVGRGNIVALLAAGYDGASKAEMVRLADNGTANSLYLQDPAGEAPSGGRSADHVWGDTAMGLNYELMAMRASAAGDASKAGRYRRSADLAYRSAQRWQLHDGTFALAKNRFDAALGIGFASETFWSSLTASQAYRFASLYQVRVKEAARRAIPELPTKADIGGYALQTDDVFGTAFVNAGGMQFQATLRGSTDVEKNAYWNVLGITRFSRTSWDQRLGPGDGARDATTDSGVSFAPTFLKDGIWNRLASMPDAYRGTFSSTFVNPVLVRTTITYTPQNGYAGPTFVNDLVVTPDGVLSTVTSNTSAEAFGVTWPIVADDGSGPLAETYSRDIATVNFPGESDQQAFIALHSNPVISPATSTVRGSYGDIRPIRMVSGALTNRTFVYPRSAEDPSAQAVRDSFISFTGGFETTVGRVNGNTYVGRTSAGGSGTGIDFNFDGIDDMTFSKPVGFMMQRDAAGTITSVETNSDVTLRMNGKVFSLTAYHPRLLNLAAPPVAVTPPPPLPPQPPTNPEVKREFEALKITSATDTVTKLTDPAASAGQLIRLSANAAKDRVTYKLSGIAPGTYQVGVRVRTGSDAGIMQVLHAATPSSAYFDLGGVQDLYSASAGYRDLDLGTIQIDTTGTRTFRFRVEGKSAASTGYRLYLDSLKLTPL